MNETDRDDFIMKCIYSAIGCIFSLVCGAIICAVLSLFSSCSSTTHIEKATTDTLSVMSVQAQIDTSTASHLHTASIDLSRYLTADTEEEHTEYSVPDSLGHQFILSTKKVRSSIRLTEGFKEESKDTLHITDSSNKQQYTTLLQYTGTYDHTDITSDPAVNRNVWYIIAIILAAIIILAWSIHRRSLFS